MNAKHLACAVLVLVLASTYPAAARAGFDVGVTVGFAPPPLPVYVQPPCPSPGYVWAPGYWAYGDDDYYWVPGTWVLAPESGCCGRQGTGQMWMTIRVARGILGTACRLLRRHQLRIRYFAPGLSAVLARS